MKFALKFAHYKYNYIIVKLLYTGKLTLYAYLNYLKIFYPPVGIRFS